MRKKVQPKKKKMDWRDLQPAAQSAIRCADPVFRTFLKEKYSFDANNSSEDAADAVREICEVKSRSELSTDHRKRMLWRILDDQFQAWQRVGA